MPIQNNVAALRRDLKFTIYRLQVAEGWPNSPEKTTAIAGIAAHLEDIEAALHPRPVQQ